ncbi:acyl-CoA thioesterase [uncultured Bradyrhizobium sp.]|uniref:acyl-CoA thioesterase n=1 Tax=uncultured Bradyrhizobium sp. TaxID=199684 RepID=UPI0035CAC716
MNIERTPDNAAIYSHPVAYADTDAGGIVYHGRYLEIVERARNHIFYAAGFNYSELARRWGVMFVIRKVEMICEAPAKLDDTLTVATSLTRCDPSRTCWLTKISCEGASIASAKLEIVAVDIHDRGIRRHPDALLDALRPYLQR